MTDAPVLLYDGNCGFCQASVQFVLRHEHRHTLRFAPLRGATGQAILARHPDLVAMDTVLWVEHPGMPEERVRHRSTATLKVLRYLGGPWHLLSVFWLVPRPVRDGIYRFVARHRHRIPMAAESCALPSPIERERFLD